MATFTVKNWDKFQHYKDRNPPWIKLATDTFQNYEFSRLQDASKLLAVCIWTLAARSKDGSVPADLVWIKNQCSLGDMVTIEHIKELIDKGFIVDASNTLASCKQNACLEGEAETEGEAEKKAPTVLVGTSSRPAVGVPFSEIVNIYHELLPELPKCAKLTTKRQGYIRQRWAEDLPSLDDWRDYFGIVRKSDFLMGKSQPTNGRAPFRADLEWLANASNIVKIIEGKYHANH